MKDAVFLKKIHKAHKMACDHRSFLRKLEAEYEKRFGYNPGDVDDDFWIDTCHYGYGTPPTLDEIIQSAKWSKP